MTSLNTVSDFPKTSYTLNAEGSKGRVLIVDDLLATGGTIAATCKLVERAGGEIVGVAFMVELDFLSGRNKLEQYDVFSLIHFSGE